MENNDLTDSELLLPGNIRHYLQTKIIGREIFYYRELSSTNEEAKRLAADLSPEGTLVVAETQLGGKGRLGRGWHSPFGKGIWVSVILRPSFEISETAKCTLLAAVAASCAIEETAQIPCGIKWPNDILWQGRKLVGILSELGSDKDGRLYLVVGVGINVNTKEDEFTPDIAGKAASLFIASGREVGRARLLASFAAHLEKLYCLAKDEGFAPILIKWRSMCVTLGKEVRVFDQDENFSGLAVDIDNDGALLVETPAGMRKVLAGDVSVR